MRDQAEYCGTSLRNFQPMLSPGILCVGNAVSSAQTRIHRVYTAYVNDGIDAFDLVGQSWRYGLITFFWLSWLSMRCFNALPVFPSLQNSLLGTFRVSNVEECRTLKWHQSLAGAGSRCGRDG